MTASHVSITGNADGAANASPSTQNDNITVSKSFTSGQVVLMGIWWRDSSAQTLSAPTWNGQTFTQIATTYDTGEGKFALYQLTASATATANVVAAFSGFVWLNSFIEVFNVSGAGSFSVPVTQKYNSVGFAAPSLVVNSVPSTAIAISILAAMGWDKDYNDVSATVWTIGAGMTDRLNSKNDGAGSSPKSVTSLRVQTAAGAGSNVTAAWSNNANQPQYLHLALYLNDGPVISLDTITTGGSAVVKVGQQFNFTTTGLSAVTAFNFKTAATPAAQTNAITIVQTAGDGTAYVPDFNVGDYMPFPGTVTGTATGPEGSPTKAVTFAIPDTHTSVTFNTVNTTDNTYIGYWLNSISHALANGDFGYYISTNSLAIGADSSISCSAAMTFTLWVHKASGILEGYAVTVNENGAIVSVTGVRTLQSRYLGARYLSARYLVARYLEKAGAAATAPNAPTIGTATASYNDTQGNIFSVTFTPSGSGSPATSYTATLSTGETLTGSSSPLVFVNTLSNGVARTATVKANNAAGSSANSAASNSATPVALLRVASVESRGHNGFETRGLTKIFGHRGQITGSGELTEASFMTHGWVETAGSGYQALGNAYTISEMSMYVTGNTPVACTWSGATSKVHNPGDTEIINDPISAMALMGTATIPVGTTIWCKYIVTLASTAHVMMSTPATVADFANSQYSFYDPAATTITNTSATAGPWTFTGTAPQARANGFAPQLVGKYKFGDPKTAITIGNSIQQGVGDATAKITGRGWVQALMCDAGATTNPFSCMNMAVSGDTAAHFKANTKLLALAKYARVGIESAGTNDLGSAGAGVVATIVSDKQAIWTALKANSIGGNMPIMVTYIQPQSTTINPVKTLNSAPNSFWGVGEKSKQINDALIAKLGSNNIQYLVDPVQVRQSSDNSVVEYFLWKYNGGTNVYDTLMTTDGTHPTNAAVLLWAASVRSTWNSIN